MKGDTIEGAELGVTVAATLRAMMAQRHARCRRRCPSPRALLDALTNDTALDIPWAAFHRTA